MYEARQNKEKVSRRIEGGSMARQRLCKCVVQMTQMSDDTIDELKKCPETFSNITLYHGDDRNYLNEISLSPVDTTEWDNGEKEQEKIKSNIPKANELQYAIYLLVKGLKNEEFNTYIHQWIHKPGDGFVMNELNLVKPKGFFNGCCCCFKQEDARDKKYMYEIELNKTFERVKLTKHVIFNNALYEGDNIRLQFAKINSTQGEVDILSPVPSECIKLVQLSVL